MVQLRKRASKVSYSKVYSFGSDDEQGPSTSKKPAYESEGSDSAFSAGSQGEEPSEEELERISDDEDGGSMGEAELASGSDIEAGRGTGRRKTANDGRGSGRSGLQTLLAPQRHLSMSDRQAELMALQHNSRPLHCPQHVYLPSESTARLTRQPSLFDNDPTVEVSKPRQDLTDWWGDVVGPGPVWKLVEDKGWYKEGSMEGETVARPRLYASVAAHLDASDILTVEQASKYLPNSSLTALESKVTCYLGQFGSQTSHNLAIFDSVKMSSLFGPSNKAHVFNAGAPIWALDWCPLTAAASKKQYLAVGPCSSRNFKLPLGTRVSAQSPACIQIWSFHPSESDTSDDATDDRGALTCEMVLCVNSGPALCLKWCPLPSNDPEQERTSSSTTHSKLGLLGGVFADGTLQFFAIPHPDVARRVRGDQPYHSEAKSLPVFVRLSKPLLKIDLEESPMWSFDWANGDVVTVGTTSGAVLVYHVKEHLSSMMTEPLLPSLAKPVHQSGIRSISWVKIPPSDTKGRSLPEEDPTMICSVGYDGEIFMTDTRDQSSTSLGRYRDVINTVTFCPWVGGCIIPEFDSVKWFNYSPVIFGRGRYIFSTTGPIWSITASDYHPFVAVAASDGALRISNMLRVSRKGYSTPKFIYKIYQMEYNRTTSEYRMLERFHPTGPDHFRPGSSQPGPTTKGKKKKKSAAAEEDRGASSSSWPPEAGVLCASWNSSNGLTGCQLLASGTASGLCRIDNLWSSVKGVVVGGGGAAKGRKRKGKEKEKDGDEMDVDVEVDEGEEED